MKNNILKIAVFLILASQTATALEDADCFKYYQYGTGVVFRELMTEQKAYIPGESAVITYSVLSQTDAPITEGSVRMSIFYNDPADGEQLIDEFYASESINLLKGNQTNKRTVWDVPIGARNGRYTLKAYYVVGKYFNLAGLTGAPYGAPAELTYFEVKDQAKPDTLYWSKKDTSVNGEAYDFSAPPKVYDGTISLKTKLANIGNAKTVSIKIQTYVWDDLDEKPLTQYTQERTINMPENGFEDVTYELSGLPASTYEIKISAETEKAKARMKVRAPVGGEKGMLLYIGIDKFPLAKDVDTTAFACYSTATDYSTKFSGNLKLEVLDEKGNVLTQDAGKAELIPTPPQGKKTSFKPASAQNTVTIRASLYDDKNNLQDERTLTYDYSNYAGTAGELSISVSPRTVTDGSDITYTAKYRDKSGTPLKGKMVVYVTNPKDKVIKTESDIAINGEYTGKINVKGIIGDYKITARELSNDKKAEASFKIGLMTEETPTTEPTIDIPEATTTTEPQAQGENAKQDNTMTIAAIAIIALIGLFIVVRRKKK